jgi:hypothetical protein
MADFPALTPSTRVFTSPQRVVAMHSNMLGSRTSMQKSNAYIGGRLTLTFIALDDTDVLEILGHHNYHSDFYSFNLPASVTDGSTVFQPTNHAWLYLDSPTITRAGGLNDVTVTLDLVPVAIF